MNDGCWAKMNLEVNDKLMKIDLDPSIDLIRIIGFRANINLIKIKNEKKLIRPINI
jgi:hypothetical protein